MHHSGEDFTAMAGHGDLGKMSLEVQVAVIAETQRNTNEILKRLEKATHDRLDAIDLRLSKGDEAFENIRIQMEANTAVKNFASRIGWGVITIFGTGIAALVYNIVQAFSQRH